MSYKLYLEFCYFYYHGTDADAARDGGAWQPRLAGALSIGPCPAIQRYVDVRQYNMWMQDPELLRLDPSRKRKAA